MLFLKGLKVRSVLWTIAALAGCIPAASAFAVDGFGELRTGLSCASCIEGLETTACGDMSPTTLLPGGRWYFQADLLAFRRDAVQQEVFQTRNLNTFAYGPSGPPNIVQTTTSDVVLSTDDLEFQNRAGHKLLLGYMISECYALEFSYFDLGDWHEWAVVRDTNPYVIAVDAGLNPTVAFPNALFSPFSGFGNPPIVGVDYNRLATINYRSSLDNVELNVRHWVRKWPSRLAVSVLWGGRHNAVSEQFNYLTESIVPGPGLTTNNVNIRTRNDLWAAQVGGLFEFCVDPGWHLEFEIKGGVAHNQAYQSTLYTATDAAGSTTFPSRVDKEVTSWLGEMRLSLVYQFGPHLTTHIGYQALYLGELALASRNFQTDLDILTLGPHALNSGGGVVYHGPSAGFVVAW